MPGRLSFSILDYSNERGRVSLATGEVTSASLPGLLTEVGELRTAIEGITLGVVANETLTVFDTQLASIPPSDPHAQVERSWLVRYVDNLPFFDAPINAIPNEGYQQVFTLTIPTADIAAAGRLVPGTDLANLQEAGMAAFVTAFEQTARSPYGGTVDVLEIRHVGRKR